MKFLPGLACLALLLASACARHASPGAGTRLDVRCELLRLETTTEEQATATFRVTNHGDAAFSYLGYSPDGPLYACQAWAGKIWERSPLGWCGTGLSEQVLAPGGSVEFAATVPRDGRRYRFEIGEPAVLTPEVSSTR